MCITSSPRRSSFHISASLESYPFRKNWFPVRKGPGDTFSYDLGKAGPDKTRPKITRSSLLSAIKPETQPVSTFQAHRFCTPGIARRVSPPCLYQWTPVTKMVSRRNPPSLAETSPKQAATELTPHGKGSISAGFCDAKKAHPSATRFSTGLSLRL